MTFLDCAHATALDRAVAEGRLEKEYRADPTLDLPKELGVFQFVARLLFQLSDLRLDL